MRHLRAHPMAGRAVSAMCRRPRLHVVPTPAKAGVPDRAFQALGICYVPSTASRPATNCSPPGRRSGSQGDELRLVRGGLIRSSHLRATTWERWAYTQVGIDRPALVRVVTTCGPTGRHHSRLASWELIHDGIANWGSTVPSNHLRMAYAPRCTALHGMAWHTSISVILHPTGSPSSATAAAIAAAVPIVVAAAGATDAAAGAVVTAIGARTQYTRRSPQGLSPVSVTPSPSYRSDQMTVHVYVCMYVSVASPSASGTSTHVRVFIVLVIFASPDLT